MGKNLLFLFPCLLLIACTSNSTPVPAASVQQMDAEEPAVYAAVLEEFIPAAEYVLMETTATGLEGVQGMDSTLDHVLDNMHSVSTETAASFRLRNEAEAPLPPDMEIGAGYTLMSQKVKSQLFGQNQDGWQLFYEQNPGAPGITSLSRVGFNQGLDQALIYIGTQSQWLAGSGYYVFLLKINGTWTIDQQVMTWIS